MNPEINRQRYHSNNNSSDDEQRSDFSSSAPDYVKHNRVGDRDDDSREDKRSQKEAVWKKGLCICTIHGFTPPPSAG